MAIIIKIKPFYEEYLKIIFERNFCNKDIKYQAFSMIEDISHYHWLQTLMNLLIFKRKFKYVV